MTNLSPAADRVHLFLSCDILPVLQLLNLFTTSRSLGIFHVNMLIAVTPMTQMTLSLSSRPKSVLIPSIHWKRHHHVRKGWQGAESGADQICEPQGSSEK